MGAAAESRQVFDTLKEGDKIEMEHEVKVGLTIWKTKTTGTVLETRRERRGFHYRRSDDDMAFSDAILIKREDGELTTLILDEFSILRKL